MIRLFAFIGTVGLALSVFACSSVDAGRETAADNDNGVEVYKPVGADVRGSY